MDNEELNRKTLHQKIGKRIKQLREAKNISQVELANLCSFEKSNMNRLEAGNTNSTVNTLETIAENLEVDIMELLNFKSLSE